ncbi:MAG: HAMP domain-containing histidine kinase [Desulfobulbaceae bacterium]|nr:HAMP domain-containing histidine kinase [Desulfobulbaceae bacterium]
MKLFENRYASEFFRLQGELDGSVGKMYEEWDFDFRALISEIGVHAGIAAREKELYLALSIEPDTPRYFRGNPVLIKDVILNLVNHSLESMKEGGLTIKVCSMPMGGVNKNRVEVIISDTGPGMQAEKLDEIFRPSCGFKILKQSRGKIISGLFVSKKLAQLMGGRVSVKSVFGWGTRYSVNFILPEASSPADRFKDNWGRIMETMRPGERMVGAAYVDNIPMNLSEVDIFKSLKDYAGVLSVMLLFDVHTGLSQNTAWLMLQQPAETVKLLNGVDICGWCPCVRLMGYWYPDFSVKTMESDRCRLRKA